MMIPLPFQMVPAVIIGVYLRANISAILICVWFSNPFTWIPLYFANYLFGCYLLGLNINIVDWQAYAMYMMDNIGKFWQPLYLGSIVGGLIVASIGFMTVYAIGLIRKLRLYLPATFLKNFLSNPLLLVFVSASLSFFLS